VNLEKISKRILTRLEKEKIVTLTGVTEQARPSLISKMGIKLSASVLWLETNEKNAKQILNLLKFWSRQSEIKNLFPIFYLPSSISEQKLDLDQCINQSKILYFLMKNKPCIIVTPIQIVGEPLFPFQQFKNEICSIKVNQEINLTKLIKKLVEIGYTQEDLALEEGLISRRGGILEIFPINLSRPVLIEFFGNKVESIRYFNPWTKKPGQKLNQIEIAPIIIKRVKAQEKNDLLSYLSPETMVILSEPEILTEQVKGWKKIEEKLKTSYQIRFETFPDPKTKNLIKLNFESPTFYHSNFRLFSQDIKKLQKENWQIIIVTKRQNQLKKLLQKKNINLKKLELSIINYQLSSPWGFQNHKTKFLFLTDYEIFGVPPKTKKEKRKIDTAFLSQLKPQDYVVHLDHGIARFLGMEKKKIDDQIQEYFVLEYAQEDKLFVPIHQADKLSKYIGVRNPILHRLSEETWARAKSRIKEETRILAKELLDLYAKREIVKAYKYRQETQMEKGLEESFPFEETPDQLQSWQDIKQDLESSKVMDRLICGDVGFGKTEIAIRAAIKIVGNGKQVVLLSPTTILSQQHLDTFTQRLKNFPLVIECLSRFKTKKEQEKTIQDLKKGKIDIIIGTHRLFSKDVQFKDLGLVIIDEEQRFGVRHKEKLKKLRTSVDVLTLTATPIPRTLNLALSGLRDISTIETPPQGRIPIKTYVLRYNENIIKEAIKKELERNGQVYFLHNKVETINNMADQIKRLVPKAKIGIAHGKLPEKKLAKAMHDFDNQKYNILVCSTIIENGLDLPNVNTLIVNQATRLGLADLYQIRGRIGRGLIQAYAYFLYHSKDLKENAKSRLQAILDLQDLGSGFELSLRDMEIRGVGNILGKEQSGSIAQIGLSLYTRLLNQEIQELKTGKKPKPRLEVSIDLPVTAFIPDNFIPKTSERFKIYQQLAEIEKSEEVNRLKRYLVEKYGEIPQEILNLFEIVNLKLLARRARIISVKTVPRICLDGSRKKMIVLSFAEEISPQKVYNLLEKQPVWEIKENTLRIDKEKLGEEWMNKIKESLEILAK